MKKNDSISQWPEVVFSSTNRLSQAIRRAVKSGKLYKIAPKIYTSNLIDTPIQIIKRHAYQILSKLFPQAVISHRSALEGGISSEGIVILSYKYSKNISLPGLKICLVKGPMADVEDTPFLDNLFISSRGRALLENMRFSRTRNELSKTLLIEDIEERLDRIARIYGNEELNRLRDQAREVSKRLGMEEEFSRLDKIIGALLGTKPAMHLTTEIAHARSKGESFDPFRLELFATLSAILQQKDFPVYPRTLKSEQSRINEAFFEAYFSNYIEGTEFAIEEAEKIIFDKKIILNRAEDSHDILSTYQIISENNSMLAVPSSVDLLISYLLQRHASALSSLNLWVGRRQSPGVERSQVT